MIYNLLNYLLYLWCCSVLYKFFVFWHIVISIFYTTTILHSQIWIIDNYHLFFLIFIYDLYKIIIGYIYTVFVNFIGFFYLNYIIEFIFLYFFCFNLFKEKKFLKYKRFQKKRKFIMNYGKFNLKKKALYKNFSMLFSLFNIKIFPFHLKLFRFFFNRLLSKTRKMSRRERFKKANKPTGRRIIRSSLKKKDFFYNKFSSVIMSRGSKKKKIKFSFFRLKKRRRNRRAYLFLNIKMVPYTRKPVGSRMGKGKGSVKNWFFNIKSGYPLFFFWNWNLFLLHFGIRKLKIFLPGKWLMFYNDNYQSLNFGNAGGFQNTWFI